jgi:hypothetical protein
VWNEHLATASAADLLAQFQVKIYDDNLVGKNLLSQCGVALTSAELSAGSYSHTCGDWNPVGWKFTPPRRWATNNQVGLAAWLDTLSPYVLHSRVLALLAVCQAAD